MNTSDIIALAALLVAIVGIPIAFILARRTRLRPELRSAIDLSRILNADDRLFDRGLSMTLGDRRITSICRSRIALWNHKGDTIRHSDNLEKDPLRLQLADGDEALQVRVLSMSRKQVGLSAAIDAVDSSVIRVLFDFLDSGDGAIVEVIHQKPSNLMILGTIQGCSILKPRKLDLSAKALAVVADRSNLRRFWRYMSPRTKLSFLLFAFFLLFVISQTLLSVFQQAPPNHLIDTHHYNLETLNGQVNFAKAVSDTNAFNSQSKVESEEVNGAFAVSGIAWLCLGLILGGRRKIPYSITLCRMVADDDTIGIKEDAKVLPEQP